MIRNKIVLILTFLIGSPLIGLSQGSVTLDIRQADSLFLKNSFYLLASSMNIEVQKAQLMQARLYPNPIVTADLNFYDPQNDKFFHIGETGQKGFQVEQLIALGGRRKAEVDIAKSNVRIAEIEFEQLVRNLKYQLHSNLFTAGQQKFLLDKYNAQLNLLDSMLYSYQRQVDKGNIALKELVRLKGAYLQLNNDRAELFRDYFHTQSTLQKILQISSVVEFSFTEQEIEKYIKQVSLDELMEAATDLRPDLQLMRQHKTLADQFLRYQKKLAIPDINVFTYYDQRGGAFNNQVNAGVSMPLPIWNRNQGAIKAARFRTQEVAYQAQALEREVISDIQNAFSYYTQTISEYQKAKKLYTGDFDITIRGMTDNFQKRNISIVEFIDFFESYNDVLTELTRIKTQLVSSAEELNLLVGKDIY